MGFNLSKYVKAFIFYDLKPTLLPPDILIFENVVTDRGNPIESNYTFLVDILFYFN